jgi:hypothetical protein
MTKTVKAWYFAANNNKLRYGDGREIKVGETHSVEGKSKLCEHGLHASKRLIDALQYAPGSIIYRVELSGTMDVGNDKIAATHRKYIACIDGEELLRKFARKCALDVVHLWDAPDIVIKYLKTGDDTIRSAAWDAAWDAVRDAAWDSAWDAAWTAARAAARATAWDAARDAARNAAWAAAGAAARNAYWTAARNAYWTAARNAYWTAARAKQNKRLTTMVVAEMKKGNNNG